MYHSQTLRWLNSLVNYHNKYLDIAIWYAILVCIFFNTNKKIFIIGVVGASCIEIACSIVSPIPMKQS